jgi:uroporphyrinogen III methyltransferase/synthase
MPLDDLPQIVDRLLTAGRPGTTPAIAIQHGTLPQQKQVTATLESLVKAVKSHHLQPPALVVVGAVAGLASELAWFKSNKELPLLGKRVLVTRPAHQAAEFMAALRDLGAEPISFPTIAIQPVEDTQPLDQAIQKINSLSQEKNQPANPKSTPSVQNPKSPYDWLVFTSANGVAAFWERLQANGLDSRALSLLKIAAIGPATAAALAQRGFGPDLVPEVYTAEGVLAAFEQYPLLGKRFLLARADIARKTLAEGLAARGAIVEEIATYRTVPVPRRDGPLPPAADIVTFTSSSTVQGYANCLGGCQPAEVLRQSQVVCIGPVTAATAQELGVPVHAVAKSYTIEGILETLKEGSYDNGDTTIKE